MLGHERDHCASRQQFGEGADLDETQPVAGIFAADQALQGQAHPLDSDIQFVVAASIRCCPGARRWRTWASRFAGESGRPWQSLL